MRWIASGTLIFCLVGMICCRLGEAHWHWLAWPLAFFEAATVGALADWFAVVALFRHPLGIPIPHTAILPNNKARVAESLATFLEEGFLTEEQLDPRIRQIDFAGMSSRCINDIVLGRRSITPEMSLKLGKFFKQSARFWFNIQTTCDLRQLRKKEKADHIGCHQGLHAISHLKADA